MLGVGKSLLYREYDRESSTINVGWTKMRVLTIGHRIIVPRAEVERALFEPFRAEPIRSPEIADTGWMLTVDARGEESQINDGVLERFMNQLDALGGAVACTASSWGATVTVYEKSAVDAVVTGLNAIRVAASSAGLPDWPTVRIEIKTYDEFDREVDESPPV
jgi:hypothetical protein